MTLCLDSILQIRWPITIYLFFLLKAVGDKPWLAKTLFLQSFSLRSPFPKDSTFQQIFSCLSGHCWEPFHPPSCSKLLPTKTFHIHLPLSTHILTHKLLIQPTSDRHHTSAHSHGWHYYILQGLQQHLKNSKTSGKQFILLLYKEIRVKK